MDNVDIKVKGMTLTITVDLSKKGTPSASGKSLTIATTKGNAMIEGGVCVGLNVYRKIAKTVEAA